ncbi:Uncharacterised protein [Mycoplasmopsis columbina]|nr:Uncharacterised protein [Mycoplasmopsis columbina]
MKSLAYERINTEVKSNQDLNWEHFNSLYFAKKYRVFNSTLLAEIRKVKLKISEATFEHIKNKPLVVYLFAILRALKADKEAVSKKIILETGIKKSSFYDALATLKKLNFVIELDNGNALKLTSKHLLRPKNFNADVAGILGEDVLNSVNQVYQEKVKKFFYLKSTFYWNMFFLYGLEFVKNAVTLALKTKKSKVKDLTNKTISVSNKYLKLTRFKAYDYTKKLAKILNSAFSKLFTIQREVKKVKGEVKYTTYRYLMKNFNNLYNQYY